MMGVKYGHKLGRGQRQHSIAKTIPQFTEHGLLRVLPLEKRTQKEEEREKQSRGKNESPEHLIREHQTLTR